MDLRRDTIQEIKKQIKKQISLNNLKFFCKVLIKCLNDCFCNFKRRYYKEFECSLEDSILSLKQNIIKKFELKCEYIDIDFQLERPIRSLGKFNLESGVLPRPLDTYTFDRYGLDGKKVNATFIEVDNYMPPQKYTKKI